MMGKDKDGVAEATSTPGADGGTIELHPGAGADGGSKLAKAKIGKGTISAHVFALAALLTSAGNLIHGGDQTVTHLITRDDSITEAAYGQLRVSISNQAKQLESTQDDVLALRNFLAGYLQASRSTSPGAPRAATVAQAKADKEMAKLLPKADKPQPPPAPPSYEDVKQEAVDEPPIQIRTKKE